MDIKAVQHLADSECGSWREAREALQYMLGLVKWGALVPDQEPPESDYTLRPGQVSCWVSVGNISVYVVRADEGVAVDLYPKGREFEPLASTYALFAEAEPPE
jgi:hypothetical protein